MWKDMFAKRKYATLKLTPTPIPTTTPSSMDEEIYNYQMEEGVKSDTPGSEINSDIFMKCSKCGEILIKMELDERLHVCPKCNHHFRLDAEKRIRFTFDDNNSIEYFDESMKSLNPIDYPKYTEKIKALRKELNVNDAVITGCAEINGKKVCFGVMDSRFIMGSMGSVVGEKLSRMFETAVERKLPAIVFTVSGGARMQEGVLSLLQMSKVSAAIKRHSNAGLLYITVITDPTTGGVTASFASLGDIIIAEPGATIGFAGKRVIEQTIRQKLPESFQSSEFLLEHGFVDIIVHRRELKDTLSDLLGIHGEVGYNG